MFVLFWQSILGYEVRQKGAPHNCLDDASAAMKLVLAKIEQGLGDAIPFVHEDVCAEKNIFVWFLLISNQTYLLS